MDKIPEVEHAKAVMTQAAEWSVMKWLKEKKKVRKIADLANAALDERNRETKATWPEELRAAYAESFTPEHKSNRQATEFIRHVRQADDEASRARQDAEDTFDEAERILSARLAREGTHKAIRSWELHETAIRRAEAHAAMKRGH